MCSTAIKMYGRLIHRLTYRATATALTWDLRPRMVVPAAVHHAGIAAYQAGVSFSQRVHRFLAARPPHRAIDHVLAFFTRTSRPTGSDGRPERMGET
jgi:hypothetical protein